jgi:uncharacterized protein YdcH (DUF465 family)
MPVAATPTDDTRETALHRYKQVFETIDGFNRSIDELDSLITEAKITVEEHNVRLKESRSKLKDLEELRAGAEKSLLRFLRPKNGEFMPLFDQMDEADEDVHGKNAADWRSEPINVLLISPRSIELLNAADIVLVGQLQDKMLDGGRDWWKAIEGLNEGIAAAIADGISEFINKRSK